MTQTKEEAQELLKQLGLLRTHRTLVGEEREQVLTMLRLLESVDSNNQHFWTETWHVGDIQYQLTTGSNFDLLEEIIDHVS